MVSKTFYFACSGCKREFFDEAEFLAHPCMARNGRTSSYIPESCGVIGEKSEERASAWTSSANANSTNANDTDKPIPEEPNLSNRLQASKELVKMKEELLAHGIECQTLNKTQTRAEYQKLIKKLKAEGKDLSGLSNNVGLSLEEES